MGKKLLRHIFSTKCSSYYKKYPINDNKICPQSSSTCFQKHFHDWFSVLRYNSGLSKLKWTLLLFNFKYIRDLTNRRKLFSIPVAGYVSFPRGRTFKTNLLCLISNITFKKAQFASFSYLHMYLPLWNLIAIILVSYFEK